MQARARSLRIILAFSSISLIFGATGCDPAPPPIPPLPDSGPIMDAGTDGGMSTSDCTNGVRDGDESSADCGGSCPPCANGDNCRVPEDCESLVCDRGRCLVPNCMDGVRNGDETGADCGGDCGLCPGGEPCTSNDQCLSGRCRGGVCAMSDCEDGRMNGDETDVDCGGPLCPACDGGLTCDTDTDCVSLICAAGICTDAACNDSVQNQDETSVDCGGAICDACRDGLACIIDSDCEGRRCFDGGCVSCTDMIMDAEETDVDCGGGLCDPCADGLMCLTGSDCASGNCVSGVCESCVDMVMNQDETDVDCGGAICTGCVDGLMCLGDSDCGGLGATCVSAVCVSCGDGVMNRDETDIDCGGGTCPACAPGAMCTMASDCASAICDGPTMRCNAPGCGDGVINGLETDLDCGGGACLGCNDGLMCVVDRDCLSGVCTGGVCQVPTCTDMVFNGLETDTDCGGPSPPGCPRCITGRRCDATSDCATDTCMMGYCGGAAMCRSGPARVLVYQPGGTSGTAWFPAGTITTIASDAMWRSLSTADFGQYDILWLGGNRCGGTMESVHGTALDTIGTWGPAVRGRIVATADDADLHGGSAAMLFHRNLVNWLKTPGRNQDAGRTSLYMSWGCTMNSGYVPGARASPESFAAVLGTGITGERMNYCSSVRVAPAATGHPIVAGDSILTSGIPPFWGCPFHGGFTTIPTGYDVIVEGTTGATRPVAIARDSPMPCIP